jgi:hypothetical protein
LTLGGKWPSEPWGGPGLDLSCLARQCYHCVDNCHRVPAWIVIFGVHVALMTGFAEPLHGFLPLLM